MKLHNYPFILSCLLLLATVAIAQEESPLATQETRPLVPLLLAGELDAITDGVATGIWNGSDEGHLARALVQQDGLASAEAMQAIAKSPSASQDQQTIAWYHLYGYARLIDDRNQVNDALAQIKTNPDLASTLFRGSIPSPMAPKVEAAPGSRSATGGSYSIQIGAFGSKSNAQRLADQQAKRGYTVEVMPLKSGGRTLYAVWVGKFPSSSEASSFGTRIYGKEGKDFRVVKH